MPTATVEVLLKSTIEVELTDEQMEQLEEISHDCPFDDCALDWVEEVTGKDYMEDVLSSAYVYEAEWYSDE